LNRPWTTIQQHSPRTDGRTREKEKNGKTLTAIALVLALAALPAARATETEDFNMQVLPAPGKVVIEGKFDEWDLTADKQPPKSAPGCS